jgi:ectoine hydroxylase-related dioxygenase (phytanoyl-CoA dioxygenase family)
MTIDGLTEQALRVKLSGYTVVPGLLTGAECDEACSELDRVLAEEAARWGTASSTTAKPPLGWAYNLMNKSRVFERLYQVPALLQLVRHFLGEDALLQAVMGRKVEPGAATQGLHFDGSLTGPFVAPAAADADRRDVELVYGLNVIWCLNDFTATNGATRLVPGSHHLPSREIPQNGPVPGEVVVEAPRGSAVVFNIATWHGQSAHTATEPRYAALTPWRRSWVRPEVDLSRMVLPEVLERAGEEGRRIFGFAGRPPYVERWQWDPKTGFPRPEFTLDNQ